MAISGKTIVSVLAQKFFFSANKLCGLYLRAIKETKVQMSSIYVIGIRVNRNLNVSISFHLASY